MIATILNKWYSFYLWFLSNVIASVLLFSLSLSRSTASGIEPDALFGFYVMLSLGLLFSIPVGALCFVAHRIAIQKLHSATIIKTIVGAVAIAGTVITVLRLLGAEAFNWRNDASGLETTLIYSISIILCSAVLKIYKRSLPVSS